MPDPDQLDLDIYVRPSGRISVWHRGFIGGAWTWPDLLRTWEWRIEVADRVRVRVAVTMTSEGSRP